MPNLAPALAVGEATDLVIAAVTVIVSLLAILVSLINANGSASKQTFEQLKAVVDTMKEQRDLDHQELETVKRELSQERRARIKYEKWARILDLLLTKHNIDHPSLDAVEVDDDN